MSVSAPAASVGAILSRMFPAARATCLSARPVRSSSRGPVVVACLKVVDDAVRGGATWKPSAPALRHRSQLRILPPGDPLPDRRAQHAQGDPGTGADPGQVLGGARVPPDLMTVSAMRAVQAAGPAL